MSVIVPAYNAAATIGETLGALAEQDVDRPYEVIVVDDGSDDATVAVAEAAAIPVSVVQQANRGAGAARNLGVARSRAPALAFTDADCLPTSSWLREGVAALGRADLVQGAVRADPRHPPGPFDRTLWVLGENGLYETANLFVRRELFERLGGFQDWRQRRLGRPFGEDTWFGWRARREGARTAFAPRALVHHAVFAGGPGAFIAERTRMMDLPAMVSRMPELRTTYCYARWFQSARSAAFDAALVGAVAGAATVSPLPLAACLPYAWMVGRRAARWRRRAPQIAVVQLAADAVGLATLVAGSVRDRALVL